MVLVHQTLSSSDVPLSEDQIMDIVGSPQVRMSTDEIMSKQSKKSADKYFAHFACPIIFLLMAILFVGVTYFVIATYIFPCARK